MESFWKEIRAISLPLSNRLVVAAIFLVVLAIDVGSMWVGLRDGRNEVTAGALTLVGSLTPLLVVAAVLGRTDSAVSTLVRRSEIFFLRVMPQVLSRLVEAQTAFYVPKARRSAPAHAGSTVVLVNMARGECCAEFVLAAPADNDGSIPRLWRIIVLRVELNVRRININLCLPIERVRQRLGDVSGAALAEAFRHTLGGAIAEAHVGPPDAPAQSAYTFRPDPLMRTIEGRSYLCLVGSKFVGHEFLWDSAEQLFFAQDFLFMVRAFITERPELFESFSCGGVPNLEIIREVLAAPASDTPP